MSDDTDASEDDHPHRLHRAVCRLQGEFHGAKLRTSWCLTKDRAIDIAELQGWGGYHIQTRAVTEWHY